MGATSRRGENLGIGQGIFSFFSEVFFFPKVFWCGVLPVYRGV